MNRHLVIALALLGTACAGPTTRPMPAHLFVGVSDAPVPDGEICVSTRAQAFEGVDLGCARTDADGWATLTVPATEAYELSYFNDQGRRHRFAVRGDAPLEAIDLPVFPDALGEQIYAGARLEVDESRGTIAVQVLDRSTDEPLAGAEVELLRGEGEIVYLSALGVDAELTATGASGQAVVLAVEPGEVELVVRHPEGCGNSNAPLGAEVGAQVQRVGPGDLAIASVTYCR